MCCVSGQFTAPPTTQQTGDMDPLLRNPHQTFNGVKRMLKDQAHHVQLATADAHIGNDHLAHQLRQQLEAWWRQMLKLASTCLDRCELVMGGGGCQRG
jgi:hypothetical protein